MAVNPRKEYHDDDDDDFETPRANRTANRTTPSGAEGLRADPNPEPHHTRGAPSRPKGGGGGVPTIGRGGGDGGPAEPTW